MSADSPSTPEAGARHAEAFRPGDADDVGPVNRGPAGARPVGDGPAGHGPDDAGPSVTRPSGTPVGEVVDLTPPAQVARAALNRAKAAARARGLRPGQPARRPSSGSPPPSGAGPGARDPQLIGDVAGRLLADRGWTAEVSVGGVMGRWTEIVGDQIAEHCTPEAFEGNSLVVRADSTAWATQLRILAPRLLDRIGQEIGRGVVESLTVLGPTGPSFRRGRRAVRGRGERDTWG